MTALEILYGASWGILGAAAAILVIAAGVLRCSKCGYWCDTKAQCDQIRKERGL